MAQRTHVVNASSQKGPVPSIQADANAQHSPNSAALEAHPTADSTAIIQVIERAALNPDVDIDKMERLLQMQERVMDRQAMMAYSAAMAAMQTELPSIEERGQTNNGCYATLEDIVDTVRPILQKHVYYSVLM